MTTRLPSAGSPGSRLDMATLADWLADGVTAQQYGWFVDR
jgi:hypothetical protein